MITTQNGNGLVFPKGGWEDDESVECAAQRETVEEAGVRGVLENPMLGVFPFCSGKHGSVHGGHCKAYIFVMHVAEELEEWPESKDRGRVWCSLPEASRRCKHEWMREALRAWVRRQGWDEALCSAPEPAPAGCRAEGGHPHPHAHAHTHAHAHAHAHPEGNGTAATAKSEPPAVKCCASAGSS